MNLESARDHRREIAREGDPVPFYYEIEIVISDRTFHQEVANYSSHDKNPLATLRPYCEHVVDGDSERDQSVRCTGIAASIVHDILSSTTTGTTRGITLSRHRP
jgi:hypothetical protein